MAKKVGWIKYFIRGLLAMIIMVLISIPASFLIGIVLLGISFSAILAILALLVYFVVIITASGWVITRVVKDWVK